MYDAAALTRVGILPAGTSGASVAAPRTMADTSPARRSAPRETSTDAPTDADAFLASSASAVFANRPNGPYEARATPSTMEPAFVTDAAERARRPRLHPSALK